MKKCKVPDGKKLPEILSLINLESVRQAIKTAIWIKMTASILNSSMDFTYLNYIYLQKHINRTVSFAAKFLPIRKYLLNV